MNENSSCETEATAGLFDHNIDLVSVLHLQFLRSVVVLESLAIEDKSALVAGKSLPGAVGVHQLLQHGGPLDLEVDLCAVLCLHLDVDVWVSACLVLSGACCSLNVGSHGVSHFESEFLI